MTIRLAQHPRIPNLPFADSLAGARLDSLHDEIQGGRRDFIVDYHELRPIAPPQIGDTGGRLYERVCGEFIPRRIRFTGVSSLRCEGDLKDLDALPMDHPSRTLITLLSWLQPGKTELFSIFANLNEGFAGLTVTSRGIVPEEPPAGEPPGHSQPVELIRGWSPPPPLTAGLVPLNRETHRRFSGDPITIHISGRAFHRRLFVGGVDIQSKQRPQVDAVLNLGEDPSAWLATEGNHPADRWVVRGEGKEGMNPEEIAAEANWVIDRLRAWLRVLVHCSAGFNRSVTACCAVLILLEGLTAQTALNRVREHHPWARPDENHWLALKWMVKKNSTQIARMNGD